MGTPYISFLAGGLRFLIPMEYVVVIEPAEKAFDEEMPVYDFGRVCGLGRCMSESSYMVVVQADAHRLGLIVNLVEKVRMINEEEVLSPDGPAFWERNEYLSGVLHMEGMQPPLAYLLDMPRLWKKLERLEPDYSNN